MARETPRYGTKELSKDTLPDFERLFETRPAPGAYSCWCLYSHRPRPAPESERPQSRADRAARDREQRRELVGRGRSHGILVYTEGRPVGWCQYGRKEELPRIDGDRAYRRLVPGADKRRLWRITCFVVATKHRKRGAATAGLKAALDAIRKKGGGIVEAYPIKRWGAYAEFRGTVSMFQREGFKTIAPYGKSNVVMRRRV